MFRRRSRRLALVLAERSRDEAQLDIVADVAPSDVVMVSRLNAMAVERDQQCGGGYRIVRKRVGDV